MDNNTLEIKDDSIGTDPTIVQTIDSLDFEPGAQNEKKKKRKKIKDNNYMPSDSKKKAKSIIRKVIFTIIVLALMAGVSYGVYYYLSLGTGKNSHIKAKFTLNDKTIYVGEELSSNVMDYGDFSTVDISECKLDTKNVDNTMEGTYNYAVTCGKAKYTANIIVITRTKFNVEPTFLYKEVNSEISINDFIKSEEDYEYSFVDENVVNENMQSAGGPYSIGINVKNENGEETVVYAVLYVLASKPFMSLTCKSPVQNDSYTIIDKISFNNSKTDMKISTRTYNYEFTNENDYYNYLLQIDNGQISIDNNSGLAITDNVHNTLKIVTVLSNEVLTKEYGRTFPTNYSEINSYYRNTKKYSCSI